MFQNPVSRIISKGHVKKYIGILDSSSSRINSLNLKGDEKTHVIDKTFNQGMGSVYVAIIN